MVDVSDTVIVSRQGVPTAVLKSNYDERIADVQRKLLALGYTGVGEVDGIIGDRTIGAILNFRFRNKLPLTVNDAPLGIDAQLLAALETAPKQFIPSEQAQATVTEIAPKVAAVQKAWWAKLWAHILAWPMAFISFVGLIIDNMGDAIEKLTPLKSFLSDWLATVPPLTLVLIGTVTVSIVSILIAWQSGKAQAAMVQGYQQGTVHNDPPAPEVTP